MLIEREERRLSLFTAEMIEIMSESPRELTEIWSRAVTGRVQARRGMTQMSPAFLFTSNDQLGFEI